MRPAPEGTQMTSWPWTLRYVSTSTLKESSTCFAASRGTSVISTATPELHVLDTMAPGAAAKQEQNKE